MGQAQPQALVVYGSDSRCRNNHPSSSMKGEVMSAIEYHTGPNLGSEVEVAKLTALDTILEAIDGHNTRFLAVRDRLASGFDRILGEIPPQERTDTEVAVPAPGDSMVSKIRARLELQLSLLVDIERESARLLELG